MSHRRDHVIIGSGKTTVSFGDPEKPAPENPKLKAWYIGVGLLLIGFLAGLAV